MHLCIGRFICVEQGTGVEPALTAWEAAVIPIYQPCILFAIYGDVKNILSFASVNVHIFLKKTGTEFRFSLSKKVTFWWPFSRMERENAV